MKARQAEQNDNFLNRLNQHPELKVRFNSILDLAENKNGDVIKADEAERQTIDAVRQLGNEVLHDWANGRINQSTEELKSEQKSIEGNGKKF